MEACGPCRRGQRLAPRPSGVTGLVCPQPSGAGIWKRGGQGDVGTTPTCPPASCLLPGLALSEQSPVGAEVWGSSLFSSLEREVRGWLVGRPRAPWGRGPRARAAAQLRPPLPGAVQPVIPAVWPRAGEWAAGCPLSPPGPQSLLTQPPSSQLPSPPPPRGTSDLRRLRALKVEAGSRSG